MKILVTGSAGFIGSHLAETLSELGHYVVGVDCFTPYYDVSLKEMNASDIEEKGVKTLRLDLSCDDLPKELKDIEVVYHLAAQPGISAATSFEEYLKNNIVATFNLLEFFKDTKNLKCFINIATSSIYGKDAMGSEEEAPKPTSYYGVTKLGAEQLALSYFRDKNMPVCSMRLFSVYGERERPEKLYPKLIRSILEDTEFPLFEGSETHLRSYTYVSDIVDGLISALDNLDKCLGEIFNLGCDTAITTGEGIQVVEDILNKKAKISRKPRRPGDQLKTRANIQKAKRILGYNPSVRPEQGLKKEVDWFRKKFYE